MGFSCGIIGLPNVGKSTIFSALTSAKAAAANFPFCTIEPNTGAVPVPDPRLNKLADIAKSAKIIPTQMTFVDIAGLIRGASKGEGLGNQFLGHIRTVDAVAHVVRCFEDDDIIHVDGTVDPLRDIETIDTELGLADLESIEKQKIKYQKAAKSGDKETIAKIEFLNALEKHLGDGNPARSFEAEIKPELQKEIFKPLLTGKPLMFIANVSEEDVALEPDPNSNRALDKLAAYAKTRGAQVVVISGKVESEIAELPMEDRQLYLDELGIKQSGLERMIIAGYQLLGLITFFTIGPKEAHAWTMRTGGFAPQAAGKIHTDFEKGFIRAEVISYDDYVNFGGETQAKEAGKLRTEGKEYIVEDGDIVHFRFNT
ncbi:MAG: redox-regulated ATPase YchF [Bdellovibrionales bacterium]|nr:redox-regulated ATPase YchF [Bdellovibrionales bacterium]